MFEIYDYMKFRALHERQEFTLDESYFRDNVKRGIRQFFGVWVDPLGKVLVDTRTNLLPYFRKVNEYKFTTALNVFQCVWGE